MAVPLFDGLDRGFDPSQLYQLGCNILFLESQGLGLSLCARDLLISLNLDPLKVALGLEGRSGRLRSSQAYY